MIKRTNERIEAEGHYKGARFFNKFYDNKRKQPWFDKLNIDRRVVNMINRLRSNHFNLNDSLYRKGYIDSARCDCGAESQDIDHVIFRCNLNDDARERLYRN